MHAPSEYEPLIQVLLRLMELISLPLVMAQNNLTLKYEEVHLSEYETLGDMMTRLPYFIEEVYKSEEA